MMEDTCTLETVVKPRIVDSGMLPTPIAPHTRILTPGGVFRFSGILCGIQQGCIMSD